MKTKNSQLLSSTQTNSWTSDAVHVGQAFAYSVQAVLTTASTITIKLQASNDEGNENALVVSQADDLITTWTDVTNGSVTLNANGAVLFDMADVSYKWFRVVVSGAGTITKCRFNIKGY